MNVMQDKFVSILKSHGYSVTKPRLVVFEALFAYGLQTTNQLIQRCEGIDRASVYRAIDVLNECGVLSRVQSGFKYKLELSDSFLPHHHHITCTSCGKQSDIQLDALEALLSGLELQNGYAITGHRIELTGLCANCKTASQVS